jgi:hypothetical protein
MSDKKPLFDESKLAKHDDNKGIVRNPRKFVSTVVRVQTTEDIIGSVREIVREQVQRFQIKSGGGQGLDIDEVKSLQSYTKILVDLNKEERDINKDSKLDEVLAGLSGPELIEYYQKELDKKK